MHVEEPKPGAFTWVLSELDDVAGVLEIEMAERSRRSYRQAMAEGLIALQGGIRDLDVGPRVGDDDPVSPSRSSPPPPAAASPAKQAAPADGPRAPSAGGSQPKATAFGFGLPS